MVQVEFVVHLEPGCDLNAPPSGTTECCMDKGSYSNNGSADRAAEEHKACSTPPAPAAGKTAAATTLAPSLFLSLAMPQLPLKGYATVRVRGELRDDWR